MEHLEAAPRPWPMKGSSRHVQPARAAAQCTRRQMVGRPRRPPPLPHNLERAPLTLRRLFVSGPAHDARRAPRIRRLRAHPLTQACVASALLTASATGRIDHASECQQCAERALCEPLASTGYPCQGRRHVARGMPTPGCSSNSSDDGSQLDWAIAGYRACAQEALRFLVEQEQLPGAPTGIDLSCFATSALAVTAAALSDLHLPGALKHGY
ncbi:hypothetical protein HPB51_022973 [Rhipicephalus microplus]|uniref:Uncharacterized protein n=1 Tax=Rhipicephalus microplus TaxID=6941 RepID=A0A9J6DCS9_RHIMP|nr:hypothetical protein HPB51_022973 [Rhipicephalus microplus]